jgi:hypothetical protein
MNADLMRTFRTALETRPRARGSARRSLAAESTAMTDDHDNLRTLFGDLQTPVNRAAPRGAGRRHGVSARSIYGRAYEAAEPDPRFGWLRSHARLPWPRPGVVACGRASCLGRALIKRQADSCPINTQQRRKSGHRLTSLVGQERKVDCGGIQISLAPGPSTSGLKWLWERLGIQ